MLYNLIIVPPEDFHWHHLYLFCSRFGVVHSPVPAVLVTAWPALSTEKGADSHICEVRLPWENKHNLWEAHTTAPTLCPPGMQPTDQLESLVQR